MLWLTLSNGLSVQNELHLHFFFQSVKICASFQCGVEHRLTRIKSWNPVLSHNVFRSSFWAYMCVSVFLLVQVIGLQSSALHILPKFTDPSPSHFQKLCRWWVVPSGWQTEFLLPEFRVSGAGDAMWACCALPVDYELGSQCTHLIVQHTGKQTGAPDSPSEMMSTVSPGPFHCWLLCLFIWEEVI